MNLSTARESADRRDQQPASGVEAFCLVVFPIIVGTIFWLL